MVNNKNNTNFSLHLFQRECTRLAEDEAGVAAPAGKMAIGSAQKFRKWIYYIGKSPSAIFEFKDINLLSLSPQFWKSRVRN